MPRAANAKYNRRAFGEKDVLRALIHQGVEITDYRTGEPITLENVHLVEREHLVELGLFETAEEKRKYDQPEYCRYSLAPSHKIITNGTKATTAGSSKQRIAKVRRILADKPSKRPMQNSGRPMQSRPFSEQRRAWPKRKMGGRR